VARLFPSWSTADCNCPGTVTFRYMIYITCIHTFMWFVNGTKSGIVGKSTCIKLSVAIVQVTWTKKTVTWLGKEVLRCQRLTRLDD
jgi:hypothetical protein